MTIYAWAATLFFAFWMNTYFGYNWFPKSDAELMADGLGLVLMLLAMIVTKIERS